MYEEVLAENSEISHEDISQRVILETSIGDILETGGYPPKRMSNLAVGRQGGKAAYMNEIIAGGLSADIMDYLQRDSYFTGVEYGRVDVQRVIDSLHIAEGHLVIDEAAQNAFEALLLARYQMFKSVYFHRTVRAAELMLVHSTRLADQTLGLTDLADIGRYLGLTDEIVLEKLTALKDNSPDLREARNLALDFRNRRLVKCVFEKTIQRRDGMSEQLFAKDKVRRRVTREIAREAGVDSMRVYLDVPTTPSVPNTYTREALRSVRILIPEGKRKVMGEIPLSKLPLVGSIAGYMDILRVYTTMKNRRSVEAATRRLFEEEGLVGPTDARLAPKYDNQLT
jgi:uncharacterized protein